MTGLKLEGQQGPDHARPQRPGREAGTLFWGDGGAREGWEQRWGSISAECSKSPQPLLEKDWRGEIGSQVRVQVEEGKA